MFHLMQYIKNLSFQHVKLDISNVQELHKARGHRIEQCGFILFLSF